MLAEMARAGRGWQLGVFVLACLATGQLLAQPPAAPIPVEPETSPLLTEPKTPDELFSSSLLLVDLARFDLAKIYLDQLVSSDPSDEVLIALRDKHGTAEFLRLSRVKELNPGATSLLEKLNAASRHQAQDPAFIDSLVGRLFGSRSERDVATLELRNLGAGAVPEMLKQMALREDPAERDTIVLTLVLMGRQVVPVLLGGLESPVEAIRIGSIEALRLLKATEAAPFLWSLGYSPDAERGTAMAARQALAQFKTGRPDRTETLSSSQAVEELRTKAWALYTNRDTVVDELTNGPSETVIVWRWDNESQTVQPTEVRGEHAALDLATRLSRDALSISPERSDLQRLYLGTLLAGEVQRTGWEQPPSPAADGAWQTALSAGEPMLLEVLREALANGRTDTAWATLQALSQIASRDVLRSSSGKPSSVLAGLNYPDPRVQFAAAIVVLRAEPQTAFPLAGRVTSILRRALTDPGQARALVIDADRDRASTLGGYLSEEGFDPVIAATGRDGFQIAAEQTGLELVVIQANVIRWDLTQTIANFRADARTAFLPIVIYGPEETRTRTARIIARNQPAAFAADSAASAAFWEQVRPFVKRYRTPPISGQQRSEFKTLAAYWLATIANGPMAKLFEVASTQDELFPLVDDADVAGNALAALSSIPTAIVQSRLAEFATNPRLPAETRIAAATQLAAHITRFGLVLSAEEVDALSKTWQTDADANLKAALAAVMGTLKPSAGLIGERLRRAAVPTRPNAP